MREILTSVKIHTYDWYIIVVHVYNPFPLLAKEEKAMCKQHKTRTACSGFRLFAAHQYLRVGMKRLKLEASEKGLL